MEKKHKTFWWEHIKETPMERQLRLFLKELKLITRAYRKFLWEEPKDFIERFIKYFCLIFPLFIVIWKVRW